MSEGVGAEIRARLDHPIIDSDGHTVEFMPALLEKVESVAGRGVRQGLEAQLERIFYGWYALSPVERRGAQRPPWWPVPNHTLDRATATLPGLHYERMPEFVHDFPGGAGRFVQRAQGYLATLCNGEQILEADELVRTGAGRVLRS